MHRKWNELIPVAPSPQTVDLPMEMPIKSNNYFAVRSPGDYQTARYLNTRRAAPKISIWLLVYSNRKGVPVLN
jgi:hypothetical protein